MYGITGVCKSAIEYAAAMFATYFLLWAEFDEIIHVCRFQIQII